MKNKAKIKKKLAKAISLMNEILDELGDTIINEDTLESLTNVQLGKRKKGSGKPNKPE